MISSKHYRIGLLTLKYVPIAMAFLMLIHCGFMILGIHLAYTQTIAGSALIPSFLIFALSNMFKFCYIHKMLTIYAFVVDLVINFNNYVGLGFLLPIVAWLGFIIGICIFGLLIFKWQCYQKRCCKIRPEVVYKVNTEISLV